MTAYLQTRDAFPAVAGGAYHPHLAELAGLKASGVYGILDRRSRKVLYVGESHTGRLYDTITRHFRQWRIGFNDGRGRRRGGTMYDRDQVLVIFAVTPPAAAADVQFAEIQRLRPRDNEIDCADCELDHLP